MSGSIFDALILIARPAAGKSEILHYLRGVSVEERERRFHIGQMAEIDDFPMLWTWFEEDDLLQVMGLPRLHTGPDQNFLRNEYWHLLIRRLDLEYEKLIARAPDLHNYSTALIEFSRGSQSGGYRAAFQHLSADLLSHAAVLYLQVSFKESRRKNRKRFRPEEAGSILYHALPDEKMETIYRDDDFLELSASDPHWLTIQGLQVPYVIFENEDDVTSGPPEALDARLEETLDRLWGVARQP